MSMDEVREAMTLFADRLLELNKTVQASFGALQEAHDTVDPLWRDSMRQQYDASWQPLEEKMEDYMNHVGPELLETLAGHLRHSREYLDV